MGIRIYSLSQRTLFSRHPGIEPGAARIEMLARLITASGSDASLAMPFVLNDLVPLKKSVDASKLVPYHGAELGE